MPWFRRRNARVVRRGVGDHTVEERKVRRVGGDVVEVRRVREAPTEPDRKPKTDQRADKTRDRKRDRKRDRTRDRRPQEERRRAPEVVVAPPETDRIPSSR